MSTFNNVKVFIAAVRSELPLPILRLEREHDQSAGGPVSEGETVSATGGRCDPDHSGRSPCLFELAETRDSCRTLMPPGEMVSVFACPDSNLFS